MVLHLRHQGQYREKEASKRFSSRCAQIEGCFNLPRTNLQVCKSRNHADGFQHSRESLQILRGLIGYGSGDDSRYLRTQFPFSVPCRYFEG